MRYDTKVGVKTVLQRTHDHILTYGYSEVKEQGDLDSMQRQIGLVEKEAEPFVREYRNGRHSAFIMITAKRDGVFGIVVDEISPDSSGTSRLP